MRILFIIHQFMPEFAAGTEMVTLNAAKSAQAGGHHVDILTCSVRDPSFWPKPETNGLLRAVVDGVPVYAIPSEDSPAFIKLGFGYKPDTAQAVRRFLDVQPGYDLVHVTHTMRMLEAVEVLSERGLPYLVTLTDFFLDCYRITLIRTSGELCGGPAGGRQCVSSCRIPELSEGEMIGRQARTRAVLEGAASVNAVSDYVADVFQREHPNLNIRVVPHGIDLLKFDYRARRPPGGDVVFGYLGTMSHDKGVHILAEAFTRAGPANARLELVGPCFDDIFRQRLETIIAGNERIALRPPVPARQIPDLLTSFDVLCMSSLWPETFSLVMHEGFAAGLPCIVSHLGSPAQIVRRYHCGAVVPAGEVNAWTEVIRQVAEAPYVLDRWRAKIPLPQRVEEEGFVYDQLYREASALAQSWAS